jgi:protein-tyrosine-phosphatase
MSMTDRPRISRRVLACTLGVAACSASSAAPPAPKDGVVFVCEHGAAKSVIAAAWFERISAERGLPYHAIARGATPQPSLSVASVAGLHDDGLVPQPASPRPLTSSDIQAAARVIVFDCNAAAMQPLAALDECWNDVPTVSADYGRARDAIRAHIERLLDRQLQRSPQEQP